VNYCY